MFNALLSQIQVAFVRASVVILTVVAAATGDAFAATYDVGPLRPFRSFAALPPLGPGDIVQIDPGVYHEVVRWTVDGTPDAPIVIRGVGSSRPIIDGTGSNIDGRMPRPRAIFQIEGSHYVIDNLEFRNGRNTGANGAGIRIVGGVDVVIRNSRITYCDMGLMGDDYDELVVESTEIAFNGLPSPYVLAHNVYLAGGGSARFSFCYIHDALSGQNFKTRGHYTELLYNYIADSNEGEVVLVDSPSTAMPESNAMLLGNVIVSKPDRVGNAAKFIDFGQDTGGNHVGTLYLINNTLIAGTGWIEFVWVSAAAASLEASNNVFYGSGRIAPRPLGSIAGADNWTITGAALPPGFIRTTSGVQPGFLGVGARDFHLSLSAGARDLGAESIATRDGSGAIRWVRAEHEYVDHIESAPRRRDGASDAGAYEYVVADPTAAQTIAGSSTPAWQTANTGAQWELGMRFSTSVGGQVTALRFWKSPSENGPHVGRLWTAEGALLASVTFVGETGAGWQQQSLTAPVTLQAGRPYVVSVTTGPNGYFGVTLDGLARGLTNGNLTVPAGTSGLYGAAGSWPASQISHHYFRDVVFVPGSGSDGGSAGPGTGGGGGGAEPGGGGGAASQMLLPTATPGYPDANTGTQWELGTRFSTTVAGHVTALRFWKSPFENGPHVARLWTSEGTLLASVTFAGETASGWQQQALTAPVALEANRAYVVTATTGPNGYFGLTIDGFVSGLTNGALRVPAGASGLYGAAGSWPTSTIAHNYFRDVVFVPVSATAVPSTLLTSEVPGYGDANTGTPWELGTRFFSTVPGDVTALRFWKSPFENGPHVGRLWTSDGTLLATVTFAGETSSGWQEAALLSPVPLDANRDYVVSVTSGPNGYFGLTLNGLASGLGNGPLRVPAGTNGLYGPPASWPTSPIAHNYFRDVVFVPR